MADHRDVGEQRTSPTLCRSALHEFAEFSSGRIGELHQFVNDVGVVGSNIGRFRFVLSQIVQHRLFQVGEFLVLVPERNLLWGSRQMKFPVIAADRLKVLAVVIEERLARWSLQSLTIE